MESSPKQLVVQTRSLVARARKQAPKTKRAGRKLDGSPFPVSAKRSGGRLYSQNSLKKIASLFN